MFVIKIGRVTSDSGFIAHQFSIQNFSKKAVNIGERDKWQLLMVTMKGL